MKKGILIFFVIASICLLDGVTVEATAKGGDRKPTQCVNGISKSYASYQKDQASWETCPWQRTEIYGWVGLGFDLNGDEEIDFEECIYAREYYFLDIEKQLGETCETVFYRCDCDGDGYLSVSDFENSDQSCLPDCNAAWRIYNYIGKRMAGKKAYNGVIMPTEHTGDYLNDH